MADRACDGYEKRAYCAAYGIEAVFPSHPGRVKPAETDEETHRDRNKIERFFGRLKQHQRLATRYKINVVSFLAFWRVAAALGWLR